MSTRTQTILARLQAELDELRRRDQFRELDVVSGLNLCSNDYLGLSGDERLQNAVIRAIESGQEMSSTGSRLLAGNSRLWEHLESRLAEFVGADDAVYFSSGYLANIGLLTALANPTTTIFSDSANHASLIDAIRLSRAQKVIYPHNDLNFLEHELKTPASGERIIVVESIFSMDGDRAPLADLYKLADRYDAGVIVDEAHATGVVGARGAGFVGAGRPDCVIATVHTCNKALASMGAFVACSTTVKQYLINRARPFIFSTALAPYVAAQTAEAVKIVEESDDRRAHLANLSTYLVGELRRMAIDTGGTESHIVPVILGANSAALKAAETLRERGFGVRAVRPPTVPQGTARLRLSLTSRLKQEQLASLVTALNDVR